MSTMTRSAEATRQAFLEAGMVLLIEAGVGRGLRTVPVAEVAKRLGRTTGAAYQIWDRQDDYHHDLVTYILTTAPWSGPNIIARFVEDSETAGSIDDVLRDSTQRYLDFTISQRFDLMILHFYAVSIDDDEVKAALQRGHHRNLSLLKDMSEQLIAMLGLRLRDRFTVTDLVTACGALVEGFKLSSALDPSLNRLIQRSDRPTTEPPWSLFSIAFEALFRSFAEPIPSA
jgi:AcrR family transcriptional regulator